MNYRFTTQSLPQLATWVGFDRMFEELERVSSLTAKAGGYPPYNVRKVNDSNYTVEIACAGFTESDIDITMSGDQLIVKGEVKSDPNAEYIYKGIAERAFERTFTLAESVVVKNATMVNGMLKISLEHVVPEEKKSRKIAINTLGVDRGQPQFLSE
jgi:molecular chaperone IbpA